MAATTPIDPTAIAGGLATDIGGQLIDVVTGVLPVLVPVLAAFWAIRFVVQKVGLGGRAGV